MKEEKSRITARKKGGQKKREKGGLRKVDKGECISPGLQVK